MVTRAKMMYSWAGDFGVIDTKAVPAQVVGEVLEDMYQQADVVAPADLVEAARPAKAPLHPLFEWNNRAAAESWRLHQARFVLRTIRVEVPDKRGMPVPVLANIHIGNRKGYIQVNAMVNDPDAVMIAKNEAVSYLRGFEKRFSFLEDEEPFAGVFQVIRQL